MKSFILLTIIASLFVAYIVVQSLSQAGLSRQSKEIFSQLESETSCSKLPPRGNSLYESNLPDIRKLGEFDGKCKSQVQAQLSYQTIIPTDNNTATQFATKTASALSEYAQYGINPWVFVNLTSTWDQTNTTNLINGGYDSYLDIFFKQLKALGIEENKLGTWVIFPLPNLPFYANKYISPDEFTKIVNVYIVSITKYYPKAKISIKLSSSTYESTPFSWSEGEYVNLVPYVQNIAPGKLESIGFEAYPWLPAGNESGQPILNPKEYLNTRLVTEAANAYGTKNIWFSTGTYAARYTNDPNQIVFMPATTRQEILSNTVDFVNSLKRQGYNVSLLVKATDSTVKENIDWSYWGSEYTKNIAHERTATDFLSLLQKENIPLVLELTY
jgi:hypothetical protein